MNFHESIAYLYDLGYELSVKKFGLENTFKLLAALDHPEKKYLKVQVAGTNGKGSTCAFLDAVCSSAGVKTGLYTSPHLISVTERIRIGGENISEKDFARHATKIRTASENLLSAKKLDALPTFFEQVTAVALSYFAEERVELAILETGLGGRFDSATATHAEIVAVTPVDYDHQNILGNSLAEIASEKAAIIRPDTKVVLAGQRPETEKIISERCALAGVSPQRTNFPATIVGKREGKFVVDFQTVKAAYENVAVSLRGRHQIENAKTAILLAEALPETFRISAANVVEGLERAVHSGRLEFDKNVLYDGAHNASGAKALREFLDEFVERPVTIIFGSMKDKDLTEIGEMLFPKARFLILTRPDNPRAAETTELLPFVPPNFDKNNVFETVSVRDALKKAFEISPPENLICVTGSLYLVGEAQKILRKKVRTEK